MLISVQFCIDSDVICCPDIAMDTLRRAQNEFLNWLSDESIDHEYWVIENGKKEYLSYRSGAFVDWLNDNVFTNQADKAKVIEHNAKIEGEVLSTIYF